MTIDVAKVKKTRVCVAEEAARLASQFSHLGQSDLAMDENARIARLELDLVNALLGVLDLRLRLAQNANENVAMGNDDPEPPANAKPVLGVDVESGFIVEFPTISAAANMLKVSMSNLAKIISNTSRSEWERGPAYLKKLPYHCTKGWAFILKERLDESA